MLDFYIFEVHAITVKDAMYSVRFLTNFGNSLSSCLFLAL